MVTGIIELSESDSNPKEGNISMKVTLIDPIVMDKKCVLQSIIVIVQSVYVS